MANRQEEGLQVATEAEDEETQTENEDTQTEEDETENDDEEDTDEAQEDEEEEEEEGQLVMVVESPPRVLDCDEGRIRDGDKQRKKEKVEEELLLSGNENGQCSQGSEWNRGDIDGLFCPICMEAWTNNGEHQISCLPCGHIYGFSCIRKWLQQRESSQKCPQCNRRCSLKDVRKLFATRLVAIDDESQKRIRSLENKCGALEKKDTAWCKKEAEWQKKEAELHLNVRQLEERATQLKRLLGDNQRKLSGFSAAGYQVSGPNFGSQFCREGSPCIFVLQKELQVEGARIFDVETSSQILLMARRLPGTGGTHVLSKMSLIYPHDREDVLLPPGTKAIKDIRFSPFNRSLTLFASLGKKLSVLSMESSNVVLKYDLPVNIRSITVGVTDLGSCLDILLKCLKIYSSPELFLKTAAWSCSWDRNNAHNIYAGLQNGLLMVFDMRQTLTPLEIMKGPTCNPIHTLHSVLNGPTSSGGRTLLSASSVGVCQWDFGGVEERSYLVPDTQNQGVCTSLAYCPYSDDVVASFRPRVETSNDIAPSQPLATPSPIIGQGILGSRLLLKKVGNRGYHKLGFSCTIVNDILLPKSTIMNLDNQKQLFASAEGITNELTFEELPSFTVLQCLKSRNNPIRDVKYTHALGQGLLCCLSEDSLQLFTTNIS